jgi:putative nucleotidyltransferase with HDIG domain
MKALRFFLFKPFPIAQHMNFREEYLILIADGEYDVRAHASQHLSALGFKTAIADSVPQTMKLIEELMPHLVILDINLPDISGPEFFPQMFTGRQGFSVPFIVTASASRLNDAASAVQNGAFDYIIKPFTMDILQRKVIAALQATRDARNDILMDDLISLHDITEKLATTHDREELLDVTFKFGLRVSKATSGSIQLVSRDVNELVIVRQSGIQSTAVKSSLENEREWPLSKWVVKNGRSLLINGDLLIPNILVTLDRKDVGSALCVPLKIEEEVIGVINCNRTPNAEPFSMLDLNILDLLAGQASIAINNGMLISSVQQKLDDLSLISTYSEQLMRLMDENDVIESLFSTVRNHFPVDIIGFLIVQKRNHIFSYWSRMHMSENTIRKACAEAIAEYNLVAGTAVMQKRVSFRQLMPADADDVNQADESALTFRHIVPIVGEAFEYGALYFGSHTDLNRPQERLSLLSSLVSQTRIALTNSKLYSDMKENYIRTIKALAIAVDAKDTYTHGHSENVMNIAEELSSELGLETQWIGSIRDAGLLHDIGKIGVPGYILNKPGTLTYEEFNGIMKTHSSLGANIVKDVPFLQNLYQLILYHHENFDGTGYPEGLKGDRIPMGARIIHVADAFEAMTSNRPYRLSLGKDEAIKRLIQSSGKQFDPKVIEAFLRLARRKGWLVDEDSR